jgi:hypothetical protein
LERRCKSQKHLSPKGEPRIPKWLVERRVKKMRKLIMISFFMAVAVCFAVNPVSAVKPGSDVNPNGFPSGPHYNLNIIGKKAGFNCPTVEYDENNQPIYGNVVFVPEDGEAIEIYMQSGKGKKAEEIPGLQVTDPCAVFDGDGAMIQLPKNEAGYRVYARALAKPTYNPDMTITPELIAVEDENGNDLVYLGLVTDNGFQKPDETFTREKGKSKAIDITGLFNWSGDVCYFSDPGGGVPTDICCVDNDLDGFYDECVDLVEDPNNPGSYICPAGYEPVLAYCTTYTDVWVFNIGDFVTYLWNVDNNGVRLLQVRFYPN